MADLMAEAARQRPDLAAARAQRDAAKADVTVARAVGRPSISIAANGPDRYDGHATPELQPDGRQRHRADLHRIQRRLRGAPGAGGAEAREANAEQVRLAVSLDVWNAYYALDSANQQLAATATLVKTAEKNQEVALGRYQAGVGTIIDLLTAQTAAAARGKCASTRSSTGRWPARSWRSRSGALPERSR